MIYLFYGFDTYRSREKLKSVIAEYRKKVGPSVDLHEIDAEETSFGNAKQLIQSSSLFSEKKLVLLKRALETYGDELLPVLGQIKDAKDTILFLWEGGLDASGIKKLASWKPSIEKIQECKMLTPEETRRWIQEEAQKKNITLSAEDRIRLSSLDSDLWHISNELEKIAVRSAGGVADSRGLRFTTFQLGDSFFTSRKSALTALLHLLWNGEEGFKIFSYLSNLARTFFIVKSYQNKGQTVPLSFGIHPFVLKKVSLLSRPLKSEETADNIRAFFEADWHAKTGIEKPEEFLLHRTLLSKK